MKLIVGLGNKGNEYDNTRHNIGFMAIDRVLNYYNLELTKEKFNGLYTYMMLNGEKIIFLKPQKYMNLSGEVIKKYIDFFKISIDDILIINDDMDLEIGKLKFKANGSSGGHNGLKNIETNLGTTAYKRLKIGISKPQVQDKINYVLGKFQSEEKIKIEEIINLMPNIINDYATMTFENLMNKYN